MDERPFLTGDGWNPVPVRRDDLPRVVQVAFGVLLLPAVLLSLAFAVLLMTRGAQSMRLAEAAGGLALFVPTVWMLIKLAALLRGRRFGSRHGAFMCGVELRVAGFIILGLMGLGVLVTLTTTWPSPFRLLLAGVWAAWVWRATWGVAPDIGYTALPGPRLISPHTGERATGAPVFKPFERDVLTRLSGARHTQAWLTTIADESVPVSYQYTGVGCFLTVLHRDLPEEREVWHLPFVAGRAGDALSGFVASFEDRQLTFECHALDGTVLPEDFRWRPVEITVENGDRDT